MNEQPPVGVTLNSFEQLESLLVNWRSFIDRNTYDVSGMMTLFCACIHNLNANATADELTDLCESLTEEEKQFLQRLCSPEGR